MTESGIYVITNIKTTNVYIGSTQNFKKRWSEHESSLRHNTHGNPHLQSSWNKHGKDTFEFGVLEYLDNLDELHSAEQFWMDICREEDRVLYNFGISADCPWRGYEMPEEQRCKISNSTKGQKNHAKSYPAFVHIETGEIIPAGFNLSALCRELGIHRQGLNAVIHGREPSYYGWILVDND